MRSRSRGKSRRWGSASRAARALRDRVKGEVEAGIAGLLASREDDPHRRFLPRLVDQIGDRIGRSGSP